MIDCIESLYYNFIYGIQNLVRFFKIVWKHRSDNGTFILISIKFQLELLYKNIEKYSYYSDKDIKLKEIQEVLILLENLIKDDFHFRCGYKATSKISFQKIGNKLTKIVDYHENKNLDEIIEKSINLEKHETYELFEKLKKIKSWYN
jgi:hypothetical protein